MNGYAATATEATAVVLVGAALYVVVTFAMARAHVPERSILRLISAAFRETMYALVVTLLFPIYVAIGHKRGRGKRPIVLVHGYTQNRSDFVYLSVALRARGFGPIYGFNYFSFGDIRKNGEKLARFVTRICSDTGATTVDLICHSMGGLVARHCIRIDPSHIRRCVTIASPHSGVAYRGPSLGRGGRQLRAGTKFLMEMSEAPLGVPMLSIFSTHDNLVTPAARASSLAAWGGRDLAIDHVGHLTILFDRRVADAIASFLAEEDLPPQGSAQTSSPSTREGPTPANEPPVA